MDKNRPSLNPATPAKQFPTKACDNLMRDETIAATMCRYVGCGQMGPVRRRRRLSIRIDEALDSLRNTVGLLMASGHGHSCTDWTWNNDI